MIKQLNVENATIKTASVEVKVLTLSGKQVTLAVFRQLPEEDLLEVEYSEAGDAPFFFYGHPWGRVNYCQKTCPNASHLHVVWQSEGELFRSTVKRVDETEREFLEDLQRAEIIPTACYSISQYLSGDARPKNKEKFTSAVERWRRYNAAWLEGYKVLEELPQLFIAV